MLVRRIWLTDFRNYRSLELSLSPALTVVVGANGQGKTNLVEALGFLATLDSFRGAPTEALVRHGATHAVVRAEIVHDDGREILVEAEIPASGRSRVQVNRQRLGRARDLLGVLRVSVFSPDDLVLIKGGPGERRRYLDDALVSLHPKHDSLRGDVERVLKQRNALLKQAGGRLTDDIAVTLDVWDAKLARAGEQLGLERSALVCELEPRVRHAYFVLAGAAPQIDLMYDPPWRRVGLDVALAAGRTDDVRRGLSLVGPHRDDLEIRMASMPARTHASQGEQRTLALALRLAAHALVTARIDTTPLLLLDDVFSELDPGRSRALLDNLPAGQVILTTASNFPIGAIADRTITIDDATVTS